MQPRVVIGHHLNQAQAAALRAALPLRAELRSLLGPRPWVVPTGIQVIVTQAADMLPAEFRPAAQQALPPPDWPGDVQWVHLRSTGIDRYPPWVLTAPCVTTSSGAQATAICEFVLGAVLRHEKRLTENRVTDAAMWRKVRDQVQDRPLGGLEGKVLGLVGFGNIGRLVAARALAFGMRVVATRRSGPSGAHRMPGDPASGDVAMLSLADVLRQADHLVIAVPLDASTRGLIDHEMLRLARRGQHLINVARGAVVDSEALLQALNDGHLSAASLDVTEPEPLPDGHPFYTHPSVTLTPHIAYSGPSTESHGNRLFCENLVRFVVGEPLRQCIPAPRGSAAAGS